VDLLVDKLEDFFTLGLGGRVDLHKK
jgi:hypothetical protein